MQVDGVFACDHISNGGPAGGGFLWRGALGFGLLGWHCDLGYYELSPEGQEIVIVGRVYLDACGRVGKSAKSPVFYVRLAYSRA